VGRAALARRILNRSEQLHSVEGKASLACDCCGSDERTELFAENGLRLGQCPHCDLLAIDDVPTAAGRMTELEAGHYAGERSVLDAGRQVAAERVLTDQFQGHVDLAGTFVDGGRWLDIGCGAGLLLTLAGAAGFEAEGIELTADRRAAAREVTGRPVHDRPVEDLGLPDASFDVISLINVFSHLTTPTGTFRELRRLLRPGGVLIVVTGEMTAGVRKTDQHNWNLGDHLYFLGNRTMAAYADKVGLDVVHHDRAWLPDRLYTREWLRMKGRSAAKNAVKSTILHTPGAFPVFRAAMLRRQRDSAAHTSVFALVPRAAG
jgi:SAM-dependent methyltransferase